MNRSLSFCTVCMNRTFHLKETLLRNIADNNDYEPLEFVLLNYNSQDDLHEWVMQELQPYITTGRLKYYHTTEPQHFHMSHAKNMVLRLAEGEILCGIDADNFTGAGFAGYVNEQFASNNSIFIAPPPIGNHKKRWDVQGRVCVRKDDFYKLHGYDELFCEYGFEDKDFKRRLSTHGCTKVVIKQDTFLQAIQHTDGLRVAEGLCRKKLKQLYICMENGPEIIYLKDNNRFEKILIHTSLLNYDGKEIIKPPFKRVYEGTFKLCDKEYHLQRKNNKDLLSLSLLDNGSLMANDKRRFIPIPAGPLFDNFLAQRAIYLGKKRYDANRVHKTIIANELGFGRGTVRKNFSDKALKLV